MLRTYATYIYSISYSSTTSIQICFLPYLLYICTYPCVYHLKIIQCIIYSLVRTYVSSIFLTWSPVPVHTSNVLLPILPFFLNHRFTSSVLTCTYARSIFTYLGTATGTGEIREIAHISRILCIHLKSVTIVS